MLTEVYIRRLFGTTESKIVISLFFYENEMSWGYRKEQFTVENKEVETRGFFKVRKRPLAFIIAILILEIIMFTPWVYYSSTAGGTAIQLIFVCVILFVAPTLALIDALLLKD